MLDLTKFDGNDEQYSTDYSFEYAVECTTTTYTYYGQSSETLYNMQGGHGPHGGGHGPHGGGHGPHGGGHGPHGGKGF